MTLLVSCKMAKCCTSTHSALYIRQVQGPDHRRTQGSTEHCTRPLQHHITTDVSHYHRTSQKGPKKPQSSQGSLPGPQLSVGELTDFGICRPHVLKAQVVYAVVKVLARGISICSSSARRRWGSAGPDRQ